MNLLAVLEKVTADWGFDSLSPTDIAELSRIVFAVSFHMDEARRELAERASVLEAAGHNHIPNNTKTAFLEMLDRWSKMVSGVPLRALSPQNHSKLLDLQVMVYEVSPPLHALLFETHSNAPSGVLASNFPGCFSETTVRKYIPQASHPATRIGCLDTVLISGAEELFGALVSSRIVAGRVRYDDDGVALSACDVPLRLTVDGTEVEPAIEVFNDSDGKTRVVVDSAWVFENRKKHDPNHNYLKNAMPTTDEFMAWSGLAEGASIQDVADALEKHMPRSALFVTVGGHAIDPSERLGGVGTRVVAVLPSSKSQLSQGATRAIVQPIREVLEEDCWRCRRYGLECGGRLESGRGECNKCAADDWPCQAWMMQVFVSDSRGGIGWGGNDGEELRVLQGWVTLQDILHHLKNFLTVLHERPLAYFALEGGLNGWLRAGMSGLQNIERGTKDVAKAEWWLDALRVSGFGFQKVKDVMGVHLLSALSRVNWQDICDATPWVAERILPDRATNHIRPQAPADQTWLLGRKREPIGVSRRFAWYYLYDDAAIVGVPFRGGSGWGKARDKNRRPVSKTELCVVEWKGEAVVKLIDLTDRATKGRQYEVLVFLRSMTVLFLKGKAPKQVRSNMQPSKPLSAVDVSAMFQVNLVKTAFTQQHLDTGLEELRANDGVIEEGRAGAVIDDGGEVSGDSELGVDDETDDDSELEVDDETDDDSELEVDDETDDDSELEVDDETDDDSEFEVDDENDGDSEFEVDDENDGDSEFAVDDDDNDGDSDNDDSSDEAGKSDEPAQQDQPGRQGRDIGLCLEEVSFVAHPTGNQPCILSFWKMTTRARDVASIVVSFVKVFNSTRSEGRRKERAERRVWQLLTQELSTDVIRGLEELADDDEKQIVVRDMFVRTATALEAAKVVVKEARCGRSTMTVAPLPLLERPGETSKPYSGKLQLHHLAQPLWALIYVSDGGRVKILDEPEVMPWSLEERRKVLGQEPWPGSRVAEVHGQHYDLTAFIPSSSTSSAQLAPSVSRRKWKLRLTEEPLDHRASVLEMDGEALTGLQVAGDVRLFVVDDKRRLLHVKVPPLPVAVLDGRRTHPVTWSSVGAEGDAPLQYGQAAASRLVGQAETFVLISMSLGVLLFFRNRTMMMYKSAEGLDICKKLGAVYDQLELDKFGRSRGGVANVEGDATRKDVVEKMNRSYTDTIRALLKVMKASGTGSKDFGLFSAEQQRNLAKTLSALEALNEKVKTLTGSAILLRDEGSIQTENCIGSAKGRSTRPTETPTATQLAVGVHRAAVSQHRTLRNMLNNDPLPVLGGKRTGYWGQWKRYPHLATNIRGLMPEYLTPYKYDGPSRDPSLLEQQILQPKPGAIRTRTVTETKTWSEYMLSQARHNVKAQGRVTSNRSKTSRQSGPEVRGSRRAQDLAPLTEDPLPEVEDGGEDGDDQAIDN